MIYRCKQCIYSTDIKCNIKRHCLSKHNSIFTDAIKPVEHIEIIQHPEPVVIVEDPEIVEDAESITQYKCNKCDKILKARRYLISHEKICKGVKNILECHICHKICNTRSAKCKHLINCIKNRPIKIQSKFVTVNEPNTIQLGWLYCVKTGEENVYKCGKCCQDICRSNLEKYLKVRYGIAITNPEIIHIVRIKNPNIAEKNLFKLLQDYFHIREMYKVNDPNIIIQKMDEILTLFPIDSNNESVNIEYKIRQDVIVPVPIDTENPLKCINCYKTLSSYKSLQNHYKTCKGTESALECHICHEMFASSGSKSKHLKKCINMYKDKMSTYNYTADKFILYTNHIQVNVIDNLLLKLQNDNYTDIIEIYTKILFENSLNKCIKKTNLRNNCSAVYVGNDTWHTKVDSVIYTTLLYDIINYLVNILTPRNNEINIIPHKNITDLKEFGDLIDDDETIYRDAKFRKKINFLIKIIKNIVYDVTKIIV